MENGISLLLALAVVYGCALSAGWLVRLRGGLALVAVCALVPATLAAPLLIPATAIVYRAASAWFSTDLLFRVVDFNRHQRGLKDKVPYREYCRFLIPFPIWLVVFTDRQRRLLQDSFGWTDALGTLAGAVGVMAAVLLLPLTSGIGVLRENFLLDHLAKVAVFLLTIESASRFLAGIEKLAGFDTPPFVQHAFLSRTVAEFWMRYNTRVHRWMYENVFRPSGGRHAPVRGVLLVFLVSGLLHELMFGIATSRFDGYQLIFFVLQAPAVLASRLMERLANRGGIAGSTLARSLTIVWMTGTSVFFFHGVHKVFPFVYVSEPWLP
jgi:MBOAT, membrane-bound O-acyltransferase family